MSLPPPCNGIIAEIGPNKFYYIQSLSIKKSRLPGQNSASITIELPIEQGLPNPPQLVAIISSDRTKVLFNGIYLQQEITYKDNGFTRQYSITINDLFIYTRKKPIIAYDQTITLGQHIGNLMFLSGVFNLDPQHVFDYSLLAEDTLILNSGNYDPLTDPINFKADGQYLNECLDTLCKQCGFNWGIQFIGWRPGNLSAARVLGSIVVKQNNIKKFFGPKDKLQIPNSRNIICPDMFWYESVSFKNSTPTTNQVLCTGVNGRGVDMSEQELHPDGNVIQSSGFSRTEVIKFNIPIGSVQTIYQYDKQITEIIYAKIIDNGGGGGGGGGGGEF